MQGEEIRLSDREFSPDDHLGVLAWTIGLHLLILSVAYWPEGNPFRDYLMVGKIAQAGLLGYWVVLGLGSYQRRVSGALLLAMLTIGFDWLAVDRHSEQFPLLYGLAWGTVFLSAAGTGLLGSVLLGYRPPWLTIPGKFSILYLAGWMVVIAVVIAAVRSFVDVMPWQLESDPVGYGMLFVYLAVQGMLVGILCWPARLSPEKLGVRPIALTLLVVLLLLSSEWSWYHQTTFRPQSSYAHQNWAGYSTYLNSQSLAAAFPTLKLGLMVVTLGTWVPWRESLRLRGGSDE